MTEEIRKKIEDAQMVLVGIGKEMEEKFHEMPEDPEYAELLRQAGEMEQREAAEQYIRLSWLRTHPDRRKKQAYEALAGLLSGKNYFVVTLCTDDAVFGTGLEEGRIVAPCGGFRALQCPFCAQEDAAEENREAGEGPKGLFRDPACWEGILSRIAAGEALSGMEFPRCPKCGKLLSFNQIGTSGYLEAGYLPQWEKYRKWLQGTLNRRLCILELGAGMEYPSVIRFPFERVAFFNQKAELIRVHSRLYQMTAELSGRGISVAEDPADFLIGER